MTKILDQAPVLTPTAKEWKDPLKYISTISKSVQDYGICKIIPPNKTWKPEFSLKEIKFKTRIQNLSDLNGQNRASKNYFMNLIKFHAQSGSSLVKVPIVDKKQLDLLRLRNIVEDLGGYDEVVQGKKWKIVSQELGYYSQGWINKAIQGQYEKWIKPFNEFTGKDDFDSIVIPKYSSRDLTIKNLDLTLLQGVCSVCTKGDDEDKLLLCDGCNQGFHLYCLEPKLEFVPFSDWYCSKCLKETDMNFGFDDGKLRDLREFQYISEKFKRDWFYKKLKSYKVTSKDVEDEFWRLVHSPFQDVEVEYGADLHSSLHGSGFPTFEKSPKSKYSRCGWNLNNLPILGKSVFRHIKSDISGMIVPWLYVGMVFSAFCWHTEDHYTYSINYLHWGEPKTWYGIPSSNADKFENVMKLLMPDLFEANPDLLFHLTTMVSPWELREHDVSVYTIEQNPGEFVVTFPRGYHAGFNQGFNFAEAVNFALPEWFSFGRECIERYRSYGKTPVFCHDELLFATVNSDLNPENAQWLYSDFKFIIEKTINARHNLMETYGSILQVEQVEYKTNDSKQIAQCFICHSFCFTNAIICMCDTKKVSCETHVKEFMNCSCNSLTLQIRFTNEELLQLKEKVDGVASLPVKWSDKLKRLLSEHERPHITELNHLLVGAEGSGELLDEVIDLKAFVNEANIWMETVTRILSGQKGPRKNDISTNYSRVDKLFGPEKTLSNYILLLSKAQQMSFECPELQRLKDVISSAEQFRERSKELLNDCASSWKDLNDLYIEGIALETGMNEICELEDKMRLVQWEEKARYLISQEEGEIKPFNELIKAGLELGVVQDHPQMMSLKKIKSAADDWRDYAHDILRLSRLNIRSLFDIEKALEDGKSKPYYKATMEQLEQLYSSIKIWYEKASEIVEMSEVSIGKLLTQNYELVKDLLIESEALSITLEIPEILDLIALSESWLQKGKRVLCRSKSSKNLRPILSDLQNNVEIFATTSISNDEVCFCRKESDVQKIICSNCNHSYHINCLKITKKMVKSITDYVCFICSKSFDALKGDTKLPTLVELQSYLKEGQALSLIPQEVHIIEEIIERLVKFKRYVFEFLAKDGANDKNALATLLRSMAGLDVTIEPEATQLRKRAESRVQYESNGKEMASEKSGPRYCICREVYTADKPMIGCDQCSDWYHWECLGLSAKNVEAMRDVGFICTICSTENHSQTSKDCSNILVSAVTQNTEQIEQTKNGTSILLLDDGENDGDNSPILVFKKPKLSHNNSTPAVLSKNYLVFDNIEDEYDHLLPPPPTWSPRSMSSIGANAPSVQPSPTIQYPVSSFLYSPFAVAAHNSSYGLEQEFMDEEIG